MRPTFFVLAVLLLATMPAQAQQVTDAQAALETLKTDVQKLQASQKPMRDAREAYSKAEAALNQNKSAIEAKEQEIKDGDKKLRDDKRKLQDAANKTGGLVAHPELPGQLYDLDVAWENAKGPKLAEKEALLKKRTGELKPAYEAAKTDKQDKERAHDDAAKVAEASARRFGSLNCSAQSGRASKIVGGFGRAISGIVSDISDDCKEVRGKIRGGLCSKEKIEELLAQLGIDAKSKECGPANASGAQPAATNAPPAG